MALTSPGPRRRTAIGIASAVVIVVAVVTTVLILGHRSHPAQAVRSGGTDASPSFVALYQRDVSGVVRVDASTCSGSGIGSGFLVAPTLVVTAADVLDGAVAVGVTAGATTTTGRVIGTDSSTDVALIRTRADVPGYVFAWAQSRPGLTTGIGVIGYPEGNQSSLRSGRVRGLGRSLEVEGKARQNLMQTDASIDGTYSGAPVLVASGAVAGLADTDQPASGGAAYAVPAGIAAPLVARWGATASPPGTGSCRAPHGPAVAPSVLTVATGPDSTAIASSLTAYFDGIDAGRYSQAYAVLGPKETSAASEQQFARSHSGSYDYDIKLTSVVAGSGTTDRACVSFTSLQAAHHGPAGETCDKWTLTYTMIRAQGRWLINSGAGAGPGGVASTAC